jgi:histidinol-phosphate aminotransferase
MRLKGQFNRRDFLSTITGAAAMSLLSFDHKAIAENEPYENLANDFIGRLCYNENPLGPAPNVIKALADQANLAHRYPDWYSESLVSDIAAKYGVSTDNVLCGSGGTEILRLSALAFATPGYNVIVPNPSYSQFPTDASLFGCTVRNANLDSNYRVDLNAIANLVNSSTKAICITNPNNPTGTVIDDDDLTAFVRSLASRIVVIIDEAYLEYIPCISYSSAIDLVRENRNVVVVKTFSKVYGLAGARVGFAISKSANISAMKNYQYIATISRPSLEAARAALREESHIYETVRLATDMKAKCFAEFENMGLNYIPSQASFFMVDVGRDADEVRSLLAGRGIYVRNGWGMPNHLRVSTGVKDDMATFLEALADILGSIPPEGSPVPLSTTELFQALPNPFNSSTMIRIHLPEARTTRLEIFDIQGRLVEKLVDSVMGPGMYSFVWNGSSGQGMTVASGTYFYRLTAGKDSIVRRMMMIK